MLCHATNVHVIEERASSTQLPIERRHDSLEEHDSLEHDDVDDDGAGDLELFGGGIIFQKCRRGGN